VTSTRVKLGSGQGPAGRGLVWQGAWDEFEVYARNDAVHHGGSAWVALQVTESGQEPGSHARWGILAQGSPGGSSGTQTVTIDSDELTQREVAEQTESDWSSTASVVTFVIMRGPVEFLGAEGVVITPELGKGLISLSGPCVVHLRKLSTVNHWFADGAMDGAYATLGGRPLGIEGHLVSIG